MKTEKYILSYSELPLFIEKLLTIIATKKIVCLSGSLGAGKTTLVQNLLQSLGVTGPVQSPTYTYLCTYSTHGAPIYHFDLYRLHSYRDFVDAGFDEYIHEPSALSLIEWPEIIIPHVDPSLMCLVAITYDGDKRCYTLSY